VAVERRYTLEEASALVGRLTEVLESMRAARAVLTDRTLVDVLARRAPSNGGGDDGRTFAEAALTFSRGLAQITAWGVVVRDLDTGLCDFRARREERDVYLCWRLGEDRIAWWHEIEAGFQGRRPLDDGFGPDPRLGAGEAG
jgi:hypothetical protein